MTVIIDLMIELKEDLFLKYYTKPVITDDYIFYNWAEERAWAKFNFMRSNVLSEKWLKGELGSHSLGHEHLKLFRQLKSQGKACSLRVPFKNDAVSTPAITRSGVVLCHGSFTKVLKPKVNEASKLVQVQNEADLRKWFHIYDEDSDIEDYPQFWKKTLQMLREGFSDFYVLEHEKEWVHCGAIIKKDGEVLKWGAGTLKKFRRRGFYRDMNILISEKFSGQKIHVQVNLDKESHQGLSKLTDLKVELIEERVTLNFI